MAHGIQHEPDELEKEHTVVPWSHAILQYLAITWAFLRHFVHSEERIDYSGSHTR